MLSIHEFKAVFDAAPDGCVVVDQDGTIRAANPKVEQLFGWKLSDIVGQSVDVLLPEALRGGHGAHRDRFARNPHGRPMGAGLDLRAQRRDGSTFSVEVSLSPWREEDHDLRIICSIRDVSSYRRLQNFSEGALRASEEERQRIARELHDDTAQRLATLILRVRRLNDESDDVRRGLLFDEIRSEIVEAADSVKRLSRGLRPPEIEELGLALALQAHVRTLREGGIFDVSLDVGVVDPYLDVTAKLVLYRIVQEAISNARRHSGATDAGVRVFYEDGTVVAEVFDEGRGFSHGAAVEGERGLGLLGMEERATMVGGRLTVDSSPDEGTRVRVTIPVSPEKENG